MQSKLARLALATFLATAVAGYGVAFADDDDDDDIAKELTGDDDDDDDDDDGGSSSSSSSDSGGDSASGSGPGSLGYKMAISTTFPTGGDFAAANVLYGLSHDAFLNLNVGINFSKDAIDPITGLPVDGTVFGLQVGAGYRMYNDTKGKIRPYIEPGLLLAIADFASFADTLGVALYGNFGVDMAVTDQFTLGIGVGASLAFANKFSSIAFGLNTASINATFWW